MKRSPLALMLLAVVGVCLTVDAQASGQGANPNGKPFVQLEGQIIEVQGEMSSLQDQIDSIVGRVDSMEGWITAIEDAIANLEATNLTLQAQIDSNADDIQSLQASIATLEEQNADLQAQIEANTGNIEEHQSQIALNESLIAAMQQSISELGTSLQELIDHNRDLIDALFGRISRIYEALELKQTIVSGQCPSDQAIRLIMADGSVVCTPVGSPTAGISVEQVYKVHSVPPIHPVEPTPWYTVSCPEGSVVSGPGWITHTWPSSIMVAMDRALPDLSGWGVALRNYGQTIDITVSALCIRLTP